MTEQSEGKARFVLPDVSNPDLLPSQIEDGKAVIGSKLAEWSFSARPGSTVIAGAMIARYAKSFGLSDPLSIGEAFLRNELLVNEFMKVAHYNHNERGIKPKTDNYKDVLLQSFKCAEYLSPLDVQDLIDISRNFYATAMSLDLQYRETNVRTQIYSKYGKKMNVDIEEFRSGRNDYPTRSIL